MTNDETNEQSDQITWIAATERFIEAAPDLGDLYAPQLMGLRHLAKQLDTLEDPPAAIVAEYSRVHRWLLNKMTGGKGSSAADEGPSLGDMLPGVNWLD